MDFDLFLFARLESAIQNTHTLSTKNIKRPNTLRAPRAFVVNDAGAVPHRAVGLRATTNAFNE